jgi:hypothetical protein
VGLFIHEFLVGPPVGSSSTLDDPILGVPGRGFFEPRATLQQPGALSTGPCPTPEEFFGRIEAKFLVHYTGYIVDFGIVGLLYQPARLHRLTGRCDNPMSESTLSPSQKLRIWLQEWKPFAYSGGIGGGRALGKAYRRRGPRG